MEETRTEIRKLYLPVEALKTVYAGGHSEVRLYRNELTKQFEVGKRIDTHGLEGAMLLREIKWLSRIRHDNLLRVHSVARVAGHPAGPSIVEMFMPYYERGSVADALRRGERFGLQEARACVLAMLKGIEELHEVEGVLHRDIKSPNILLTGDRHLVVISDLGIAAPMEDDGTAEGYPSAQLYTAPEVFMSGRVSRRSDLYGVGLVLFEMTNGPMPWDEYDDRLVMATRLSDGKPAPMPRHLRFHPYVPPDVRRLITKCLCPEEQRPNSAAAMRAALSQARIVDWDQTIADADRLRWEGSSPLSPDRSYCVELRRRQGTWILSCYQRKSKWLRVLDDQTVAGMTDPLTAKAFDQMVQLASRR